ncbi:MAG: hypothetical protein GEV05_25520 [Betaproteobacteria bacterium]|nr:hypothetical protein [Betaproteobacteria bacterium]
MKKLLVIVLLPPVAFVLPWFIPAVNRQWVRAAALLLLWLLGYGVMLSLWSGVGMLLVAALGLWAVFTTTVEIRVKRGQGEAER